MTDDKNKPENGHEPDEFGLVPPTGNLADENIGERPAADLSQPALPGPTASDDEYKQMGWKGFEEVEEEVDPDPDLGFGKKESYVDEELDMTPMVDVTFLLLIFFIVTASFTLQKSIQQPPSNIDDPSTNVIDEPEDEDQYVEVIIDQNNSYYVTSKDEEEVEAPSDREMRAQMKDKKIATGATRLIIKAHVDSIHTKVVTVWDAGIAAGMERIEMKTIDEDY